MRERGPAAPLVDVSRCPLGVLCESCGIESPHLGVGTARTPLGMLCLTLCSRCARSGHAPLVTVRTANRFVIQHCQHLGITVDEMAAVLAEDGQR